MMGVLGITLGIVIWAGVALMGLHLILEKMAWLHEIIMVGGGLYLLWMGWTAAALGASASQATSYGSAGG
jgi:LysE type translocator.